jgi:hypothetical protein
LADALRPAGRTDPAAGQPRLAGPDSPGCGAPWIRPAGTPRSASERHTHDRRHLTPIPIPREEEKCSGPTRLGGRATEGPPKTKAGERLIFLDAETARMLREHRTAQVKARMPAGEAWQDNDLIFARADGSPWPPDYLSRRFKRLAAEAGVPVMTLHEGGRHTGNSLRRDAGVDQEIRMRQASYADREVNDRYTHVREEAHLQAAEQVARLIREAGA